MSNYLRIIDWLIESERIEVVSFDGDNLKILTFQHDYNCGIFRDKECDCEPDAIILGDKVKYPKEVLQ